MTHDHTAYPDPAAYPVAHAWDLEDLVFWEQLMTGPPVSQRRSGRSVAERSRQRPGGSLRPVGAALNYGLTGVALSRVRGPHRRRPITPATTVALALLAALITVWLGLVAQFGGLASRDAVSLPDRLAVVQVQAGETLAHVAARVAPDAPVGQVVNRIRELNELDTAALDAGQTLIAPVR